MGDFCGILLPSRGGIDGPAMKLIPASITASILQLTSPLKGRFARGREAGRGAVSAGLVRVAGTWAPPRLPPGPLGVPAREPTSLDLRRKRGPGDCETPRLARRESPTRHSARRARGGTAAPDAYALRRWSRMSDCRRGRGRRCHSSALSLEGEGLHLASEPRQVAWQKGRGMKERVMGSDE